MPSTPITYNVGSEADLTAAIQAIDAGASGNSYKIVFTSDIMLSKDLPIFDGSATISIDGAGHALDGAGQYRGLFVDDSANTVQISNLTIRNALALGGTVAAPEVTLTRSAMLGAAVGTMVMPGVGTGAGARLGDRLGQGLKGLSGGK